jgi:hypothetical protein
MLSARRRAEAPVARSRRERAAITTAMRHLLDAVKSGRATDTLLQSWPAGGTSEGA